MESQYVEMGQIVRSAASTQAALAMEEHRSGRFLREHPILMNSVAHEDTFAEHSPSESTGKAQPPVTVAPTHAPYECTHW
jgi:hypothetical protein